MKKIPTLFKREYENHRVVNILPEVTPGMEWVLDGEGQATEKIDGACCAIINGELYKRYDAKRGKNPPEGANCPCCYTDESDSESFCSVYGDDIPDIFNGRLDGCPLVELPENHGRLIDADELIRRLNDSGNYVSPAIISYIEAAPTIINSGD